MSNFDFFFKKNKQDIEKLNNFQVHFHNLYIKKKYNTKKSTITFNPSNIKIFLFLE